MESPQIILIELWKSNYGTPQFPLLLTLSPALKSCFAWIRAILPKRHWESDFEDMTWYDINALTIHRI